MDYKEALIGFAVSILLFVNTSCSSTGNKTPGTKVPRQPACPAGRLPDSGKIHENLPCSANPEITYALYLPAKLKPGYSLTWPVIIVFDSHASGLLPVQKYCDLAEKYGYILVGSNNSKNGQTAGETENIAVTLLTEVLSNYPTDTSRIYLAGFSGGSRVASLVALTHKEVKGVIGCGAGFAGMNRTPTQKFDYFGCVGLADFNLNEMLQLDEALNRMNFRHFITTFNGPHEWPPSEIMEKGFLWLTMNAVKDGRIKKDDQLINSFMTKMAMLAADRIKEGKKLEGANILELELNSVEGLADITTITKCLDDLKQNPDYMKLLKHREDLLAMEQKEQQMMIEQLFMKDVKWWDRQIKKYGSNSKRGNDMEETMKNKRLLSFLSLLCYSNAHAEMKQNNTELSFKMMEIYELADPKNPEPNYLRSILFMQQSDTLSSMNQLQNAINKGFSDKGRVIQQNEFQSLKEYRPFFDLLQKMK